MPRPSTITAAQPLAVQLVQARFRQKAMAVLLTSMKIDPAAVSHELGGELWLCLQHNVCTRLLRENAEEPSLEEQIKAVCADLGYGCQLALESDNRNGGVMLKINSPRWFLIAKPSCPAWVVTWISPQTMEIRDLQIGLPWRLTRPDDNTAIPQPLPLWLLSRARIRGDDLHLDVRSLRNPERQTEGEAEARRLTEQMRDQLPKAMQDLGTAFRLLQWECERHPRLSWRVTVTPLSEAPISNDRCSYLLESNESAVWPQRPQRMALGPEQLARWVMVAQDPDSPSRWLLHGPAELPREVTLFQLAEFEYSRQAKIVSRLATPKMIRPQDAALAATQIDLPTTVITTPELQPLPGESPWETRQEEALRLALAGHPVCAIKGPPGTGKSTVIVGLIRRAIQAGQRVLLVAPTHVALDEVLGRVHHLRVSNLERTILPARVAPADERKIKPELEDYIARRLGRNLAQKSQRQVRAQLAALPPIVQLDERIRRCGALAALLRAFAACRAEQAQAHQHLNAVRVALHAARNIAKECTASLQEAHSSLQAVQQQEARLAAASQQFAQMEARFSGTIHALRATSQHHGEERLACENARSALEVAEKQVAAAEAALAQALTLADKRLPRGKFSRFIERILAPHARAMKAAAQAEAALAAARHQCEDLRQSLPAAEAGLAAADWALQQARASTDKVEIELRERLAPAEADIASALGGEHVDWFSAMPDSLRQAVASTSESVRSATEAHAQAKRDRAQAAETENSADAELSAAKVAAEAAHVRLAVLENDLSQQEISATDNLPHQIAEFENEHAAASRELESITHRRQLLQRWLAFYEREDGDEQITAWALNAVNLVAATTQGIASSREFSTRGFDLVICDESSRVTRGEILVPADRAARIVLVGDERQLPPYVESEDEQLIQALATLQLSESRAEVLPEMAQQLCDAWNVDEPEIRPVRVKEVCERASKLLAGGSLPAWPASTTESLSVEKRLRAWRAVADSLTSSCFDHLLSLLPQERVVRLAIQRRMVAEIATLVSGPVYDGDYQSPAASPVAPLLTEAFRHAWVFFNTRNYCTARPDFRENHQGTGFTNLGEAQVVVLALRQHAAAARRAGRPVSLMVITFYLAQARLIESLVSRDKNLRGTQIAILPIDRCQGQEADAVVVSFVRTLPRPRQNAGLWLQDVRRLNVAFTRARHSLVLVGNLQTLTALRGDAQGERLLAHLGECVTRNPDHQIEQLLGL